MQWSTFGLFDISIKDATFFAEKRGGSVDNQNQKIRLRWGIGELQVGEVNRVT